MYQSEVMIQLLLQLIGENTYVSCLNNRVNTFYRTAKLTLHTQKTEEANFRCYLLPS